MLYYSQECVGMGSALLLSFSAEPYSVCPTCQGAEEKGKRNLSVCLFLVGSVFSHKAGGIVLHCDFLAH